MIWWLTAPLWVPALIVLGVLALIVDEQEARDSDRRNRARARGR